MTVHSYPYIKLLFHGLWFFIPGFLWSHEGSLKFEYLATIDRLSHNSNNRILQDKQGYIWFATEYGLNRYDGYGFKVFKNIPGVSCYLP